MTRPRGEGGTVKHSHAAMVATTAITGMIGWIFLMSYFPKTGAAVAIMAVLVVSWLAIYWIARL